MWQQYLLRCRYVRYIYSLLLSDVAIFCKIITYLYMSDFINFLSSVALYKIFPCKSSQLKYFSFLSYSPRLTSFSIFRQTCAFSVSAYTRVSSEPPPGNQIPCSVRNNSSVLINPYDCDVSQWNETCIEVSVDV